MRLNSFIFHSPPGCHSPYLSFSRLSGLLNPYAFIFIALKLLGIAFAFLLVVLISHLPFALYFLVLLHPATTYFPRTCILPIRICIPPQALLFPSYVDMLFYYY